MIAQSYDTWNQANDECKINIMFKLMIYLIEPLNKKEWMNKNELVHITYRYRRYGVKSTLQRLMSTYVRTLYTSQVLFRCYFKHRIIY